MSTSQGLCSLTKGSVSSYSFLPLNNQPLLASQTEMKKVRKNLQNCCYGVDYSIKALKSMDSSVQHFQNIQELLKNAVFMKQQLDYEANIRARVRAKQQQSLGATSAKKSAFQRFSGSFDIPAALITSSLSGISNSASADLKELKNALSSQFKGPVQQQSSGGSGSGRSSRKDSTETASPAFDALNPRPSTSRDDSS